MDNIKSNRKQKAQKKYRKNQSEKGLVRFEIQVNKNTKALFDRMVSAIAEQLIDDVGDKLIIAKARRLAFDNMINSIKPDFLALIDRIESLKAEVAALSPHAQYFKTSESDRTALPEAIQSLPDDPAHLKALINKFYKQSQQSLQAANEYKRRADQYLKLHEASESFNDVLQKKLKEAGIPVNEP